MGRLFFFLGKRSKRANTKQGTGEAKGEIRTVETIKKRLQTLQGKREKTRAETGGKEERGTFVSVQGWKLVLVDLRGALV